MHYKLYLSEANRSGDACGSEMQL